MLKIFDYYCTNCKKDSEQFVYDDNPIICLKCGGEMKRMPSAPPFFLKGNCWAKDNYGLKQSDKGVKHE